MNRHKSNLFGILLLIVLIFNSCFKDDLLKEIDTLKAQVSNMQKRNDSLNNVLSIRADSLGKALSNAQKRSDSLANVLRTKSDSLSQALGLTNASLANLTKSVDSIKTRIASISGQLTQLNIQLTSITTQLTQLNQQLGALGGDVSQLAAQYQALSASLQTINNQIAALQAEQLKLLERLNAILFQLNPAVDITTGLVAYYPFSGNAGDSSGNGNHAVNFGATLTTDRFGIVNKAYNFNGINNYMNVPYSNSIGIQRSFSSSVWINMSGGGCNPRVYELHEVLNCGGYTLMVMGTSNTSRTIDAGFGACTGPSTSLSNNGFSLSAGVWHHISVTVDGTTGTGKLYIDGVLVFTKPGIPITSLNYYGAALTIGNINSGRCDWWGGKIDELRFYNRALTQEQITYLATH